MRISNTKLIAVLGLVLAASLAVSAIFLLRRPQGPQVVVTVGGKEISRYDLHRNRTVVITAEDGQWHNTLTIQDGKAFVAESDCSNQICVHTPPLSEDTIGIIVCLPHELVVELK